MVVISKIHVYLIWLYASARQLFTNDCTSTGIRILSMKKGTQRSLFSCVINNNHRYLPPLYASKSGQISDEFTTIPDHICNNSDTRQSGILEENFSQW